MAMVTATIASPSSNQDIPTAVPVSVTQKPPSTRRLPPPCWSHDETVALIEAYRDKWYSLRRGNLRANHWLEVADDIANRCSPAMGNQPKTSVQCRHKMEKLRKRYRSEMQRAVSIPGSSRRFSSSWVHFKHMDSLERGPNVAAVPQVESAPPVQDDDEDDENEIDDDEELYQATIKRHVPYNRGGYENGNGSGGVNGFRIRIPGVVRPNAVMPEVNNNNNKYSKFGGSNPSFGSTTRVMKDGYSKMGKMDESSGKNKRKRGGDPVEEMASAIKSLGDGFVRMEKMKMDMAREVESMRMEMEMKRTEMILESQQRIVEAFARAACSEKKSKMKMKRMMMHSPES
ncbi:trihelix transcription factor ASIL2-like [Impatiens glandulifera]|uniref:trihelix transcription factor ASIL2-like n=1 Tax=Impatiens glandulifera TaxID=253017 RepID=UPI001FB07085|nr:trihelix transcription factor ASIL2-like [Impatiens glandulifera]